LNGLEPLPGKVNYFIGNDSTHWHSNIPTYAKVRYQDVYPGIDLLYYGNDGELEYDFLVAAGADPRRIALEFDGVEHLEIDAAGRLLLHVAGGVILQHKPVIYEDLGRDRREVDGGYVLHSANRVGFVTAAYDSRRPLVLDPVLSYSTYLGSRDTEGLGIAVDATGNAYLVGHTWSAQFPTSVSAWQTAFAGGGISGGGDAFVTKLDPTGASFVYSTYLGGGSRDDGQSLALDADGNVYVAGHTRSADFPTTSNALRRRGAGEHTDAFVAKLDRTGSHLLYSTLLGGDGHDAAYGIAVDTANNAFVTGVTSSTDFPTTASVLQSVGGVSPDAFVAKLDRTGSALLYSTYFGGSGRDSGNAIAVDALGNAFLAGDTDSVDLPTSTTALQSALAASGRYNLDAFVAKLDSTASAFLYST
jgi:hypothetical protein